MEIHFFDAPEFRKWLEKNHQTATEIIIGYYKKGSGKEKMDWSQSVDQAICFGWIDGVRRSVDKESYCIRFTPRKPSSVWSNINIKKVEELSKQNLMQPAGVAAYEKRKAEKSGIYSFENEAKEFSLEFETHFKVNEKAWKFFSAQPPGYKKQHIHRVMSAKQLKTQLTRLEKLIEASAAEKRLN